MSKIYVVFRSGQCGEFILSLLIGMKHKDNPWRMERLYVLDTGSCHENRHAEPEIVCTNKKALAGLLVALDDREDFIKVHTRFDCVETILQTKPNDKVILLLPDVADFQHKINHLFKTQDVDNLTKPDVDAILEGINHGTTSDHVKLCSELTAKYPGRFFPLPLDLIYTDRDKTLEFVENVSGMTRTDELVKFYNRYMVRQPTKDIFEKWYNELR